MSGVRSIAGARGARPLDVAVWSRAGRDPDHRSPALRRWSCRTRPDTDPHFEQTSSGGIALAGPKTQGDSVDTAATSLAPLMLAPSGGFLSTVMAAKKR